jgi:hypothetical protein
MKTIQGPGVFLSQFVTDRVSDDFAGSASDGAHDRRILGLS